MKRADYELVARTIKGLPLQPLARIVVVDAFTEAFTRAPNCAGFDRYRFRERAGIPKED